MSNQPLSGLRVLDFSSLAMGPLAGQLLGDYGADVIKIEPPAGDPFRHTLPTRSQGMGHVYLQFNRNKQSLVADLKAPEMREVLHRLIVSADIMISNMRPVAMASLGLGFEEVHAINPGMIYCAAYGYSENGPYAGRPAADDTIQAVSGLADLQGRIAGSPQLVASVVADKACGLMLANAVLAAVIHRMKTGRGQFIEVPMFETMVAFVMPEHMGGLAYEPPSGRAGYSRILNPWRRPYATKDGYLSVLPYTAGQWQRFFRLIGREDLAGDPELDDPVRRNQRAPEFYALIAEAMPARGTKEWVTLLGDADILFGEVLRPEDLIDDPHLKATQLFTIVEHPTEGSIRLMNPPVRSSEGMTRLTRLPPTLGQHSRAILNEIGISPEVVADLVRRGIVVDGAIGEIKP